MSPETIAKVEKIIVPSPPPAVLQFLKAQIGFFKGDPASYFGNSAASVRFLGLAAALVTIVPSAYAAYALDLMLRDNKTDLTVGRTVRQLSELLSSLESRCQRGSFALSLVGWHAYFREAIANWKIRRSGKDIKDIDQQHIGTFRCHVRTLRLHDFIECQVLVEANLNQLSSSLM